MNSIIHLFQSANKEQFLCLASLLENEVKKGIYVFDLKDNNFRNLRFLYVLFNTKFWNDRIDALDRISSFLGLNKDWSYKSDYEVERMIDGENNIPHSSFEKKNQIPKPIPLEEPHLKDVLLMAEGKPLFKYKVNKEDKREGEFIEYWSGTDKIRFQGTYKNGKKNGTFFIRDENNVLLSETTFKDDLKDGNEFIYEKGKLSSFCQWKLGQLHGCKREYGDGSFKGEFYQEGNKVEDQ
jgi:antitoxin component YwqK of YwqJK toxin-antitoxin module